MCKYFHLYIPETLSRCHIFVSKDHCIYNRCKFTLQSSLLYFRCWKREKLGFGNFSFICVPNFTSIKNVMLLEWLEVTDRFWWPDVSAKPSYFLRSISQNLIMLYYWILVLSTRVIRKLNVYNFSSLSKMGSELQDIQKWLGSVRVNSV